MAEMRSEPLEPEPDSTGVGMVTLSALLFCSIIFSLYLLMYYNCYSLLRAAIYLPHAGSHSVFLIEFMRS